MQLRCRYGTLDSRYWSVQTVVRQCDKIDFDKFERSVTAIELFV